VGEIFEKVNLPLVAGAALEARDKFGQTALFIACMDDCLGPVDIQPSVTKLVHFPPPEAKFSSNRSTIPQKIPLQEEKNVLRLARNAKCPQALDPLDGARVSEHLLNVADKQGRTPLHSLAMHGSFELMKVLLEAGADPNMAAKYDQTPLHVAATTTGRPSSQRGTGRPAGRRAV